MLSKKVHFKDFFKKFSSKQVIFKKNCCYKSCCQKRAHQKLSSKKYQKFCCLKNCCLNRCCQKSSRHYIFFSFFKMIICLILNNIQVSTFLLSRELRINNLFNLVHKYLVKLGAKITMLHQKVFDLIVNLVAIFQLMNSCQILTFLKKKSI